MDSAAWYLVYTQPKRELLAKQHLQNQHYTVFLPQSKVIKKVRGVKKEQLEPFFPRYLFIRLDAGTDDWGPIRSTIGVVGLVRFGGVAARVPTELVQRLQQQADEISVVHHSDRFALQPGDRCRIVDGPFIGHEVSFTAMSAKERAFVILEIASQYSKIDISAQSLEKISPT